MLNYTTKNSFNLFCEVEECLVAKDMLQLGDILAKAHKDNMPIVPLGEGSNVILPAKWYCRCVQLGMDEIEITEGKEDTDEVLLRVGAGKNWHGLVTYCVENGYHGLENLALIPGQCGAAPIQNIGAYGVELKNFLVSVEVAEIETGASYIIDAAECELGYRSSKFKHAWRDKFIITHINLRLHKQPKVNISYASLQKRLSDKFGENLSPQDVSPKDVFDSVVALRTEILPDPKVNGNAGSFFHNPVISAEHFAKVKNKFNGLKGYELGDNKVRVAAASLLEALGFKGYKKGENTVAMSPQHSLCMINLGEATQADVIELATEIKTKAMAETSIELTVEPRIY